MRPRFPHVRCLLLAFAVATTAAPAVPAGEGWCASGRVLESGVEAWTDETPALTLEAWVRLDDPAGRQRVFGWRQGGSSVTLEIDQGRKLLFAVPYGNLVVSTPAFADWTHLAASWDITSGRNAVYVNGKRVGGKTEAGGRAVAGKGAQFRLGADEKGGKPLQGCLGRVTVYRRVLTDQDIAARASDRGAGPAPEAWVSWDFSAQPSPDRFPSTGGLATSLEARAATASAPATAAPAAPARQENRLRVALAGDGIAARRELSSALGALLGPGYEVRAFAAEGLTVQAGGATPWTASPQAKALLAWQPHITILMFGAADTRPDLRAGLGGWTRDFSAVAHHAQQGKGLRRLLLATPVVEPVDVEAGADAALASDKLEVALRLASVELDATVLDTSAAANHPPRIGDHAATAAQAAAGALAAEITGGAAEWNRLTGSPAGRDSGASPTR